MFAGDALGVRARGVGVRLADDIRKVGKSRGDLFPIFGQAHGVLENCGHGRSIEVQEAFFVHEGAKEGDEVSDVGLRVRHRRPELRLHLKELAKVGVEVVEEEVQVRIADEDHLEVEGDGFGSEAAGGDDPVGFAHVFYDYGAFAQGALESVPRKRGAKEVGGRQDEVPAVRPVERSGPKQREVRAQDPKNRFALDPTDEVGKGRVSLHDDGSSVRFRVVHEHVHGVAAEGIFRGKKGSGRSGPLRKSGKCSRTSSRTSSK